MPQNTQATPYLQNGEIPKANEGFYSMQKTKPRFNFLRIHLKRMRFSEDHRARLPIHVSRFLGYRPPQSKLPYEPLPFPPFIWLNKIPLHYEVCIFGWIGAFGAILLIEAIMSTNTAFRDVYHTPTIITSFGASAVLLFGVVESPLSQPRNFILGHLLSALIGTAITRLFVLNASYQSDLDNTEFHPLTFINGALSMATSLLGQLLIGAVHPPAGATGLNAAVQSNVVSLSWRYLPIILASCLIMLGWAMIVNNLGRRRYPMYWWEPQSRFVVPLNQEELARQEANLRSVEEGDIETLNEENRSEVQELALFQSLEGEEGN